MTEIHPIQSIGVRMKVGDVVMCVMACDLLDPWQMMMVTCIASCGIFLI